MNRNNILKKFTSFWVSLLLLYSTVNSQTQHSTRQPIRPGNANWPRAWVCYREWEDKDMAATAEKDFDDMKAHEVSPVSMNARSVEDAKIKLALSHMHGIKFHFQLNKMNVWADMIQERGLQPNPFFLYYRFNAVNC